MPLLFHPPWLDHHNNMWWRLQIIKFLIMQFSPASCYFLLLRSTYMWASPLLKLTDTI
jgi:hypothetical protein